MAKGTIRYWAAAKAAAGIAEEPFEGATLAEVIASAALRDGRDEEFGRVIARSSFLVNEQPVGKRAHEGVELSDGDVVEVLPPFAGG